VRGIIFFWYSPIGAIWTPAVRRSAKTKNREVGRHRCLYTLAFSFCSRSWLGLRPRHELADLSDGRKKRMRARLRAYDRSCSTRANARVSTRYFSIVEFLFMRFLRLWTQSSFLDYLIILRYGLSRLNRKNNSGIFPFKCGRIYNYISV